MVDFTGITRDHVKRAAEECDQVGRDAFLETHGFGPSRGYELVIDGRTYDSKATLGVAHGFAHGHNADSADFSGGRFGAAKVLTSLGFEVTEPTAGEMHEGPATGVWREATEVGGPASKAEWAAAARPVLLDVARRYHAVITYGELGREVQHLTAIRTRQQIHHWINWVLLRVAQDCDERGEPNLSALVVDRTGSVGPGYAKAVTVAATTVPGDNDDHAAHERLACYQYFKAPDLPADGGHPALSPQLHRQRDRARRATPPRPEPLCPTCFVTLPASGQCDSCG